MPRFHHLPSPSHQGLTELVTFNYISPFVFTRELFPLLSGRVSTYCHRASESLSNESPSHSHERPSLDNTERPFRKLPSPLPPPPPPVLPASLQFLERVLKESGEIEERIDEATEVYEVWEDVYFLHNLKRAYTKDPSSSPEQLVHEKG
uniref:Putative NAD(P)-binding protein n=1 Tax=Moniliophthora roreri TaxID=221103 RepID=A0A0W0FMA3_MONRR